MKTFQSIPAILLMLAPAVPGFGQSLKAEVIANPAAAGSVEAHWSTAQDGSPLLSWIEPLGSGSYALRYAIRQSAQWSQPRTIVANRHFFRQPAESPSVVSFPGGAFLAEWVEIPSESSEAEDVYVAASTDGVKWSAPAIVNQNRSPVQHALVSMVASSDQEASLVWLEALKGEDAPSVLKRTIVSREGKVVKEENLDKDVCTCCPTSIVRTARGLLVAYRGHTPQDIRDIAVVRFENGRWLQPKILNPDKWKIDACPVNSASAAAKDNHVAIAWYTEAGDKPRVQLVFSSDGGTTFTKPTPVNTGYALGHASTVLNDDGGAFVSWIEEGDKSNRLLARFISAAGVAEPVTEIAQGSTQSLGYPRLLHAGKETWIAWGNSASTRVQTARLTK